MSRKRHDVQLLKRRGQSVSVCELKDRGSRIEIPQGTKIVSVVIPVEGNSWTYAEQLGRELVEDVYREKFGEFARDCSSMSMVWVTTQVVVELRVTPW